jgi:hypothetical protein
LARVFLARASVSSQIARIFSRRAPWNPGSRRQTPEATGLKRRESLRPARAMVLHRVIRDKPMTPADKVRHRARQPSLFPQPACEGQHRRFANRLGQASRIPRPAVVLCATCGMKKARYGLRIDEQTDRPRSFCFECFLLELQRRRRRAQIAARRALER